jgi:hypothetical protein
MSYKIKVFLGICFTMIFMLGLFDADMGVSMLNNSDFVSLMVPHLPPDRVYHFGLVLMVMSFFFMVALVVFG